MKRHTVIAATLLTSVGLALAGCSADDSTSTDTSATASQESPASESTESPVEAAPAEDRGTGEPPAEYGEEANKVIAAFKEQYPTAEETDLNALYEQMGGDDQSMETPSDVTVEPPQCDFSDETKVLDNLMTKHSKSTLLSKPAEMPEGQAPASGPSVDLVVAEFGNEDDAKELLKRSDVYSGDCTDITITSGTGEQAVSSHNTYEKSDLKFEGADDSFSGVTTVEGARSYTGETVYGRFGNTVVQITGSGEDPEQVTQLLQDAVDAVS
ncbi:MULTISPECIES: hypothetical protein [Corynebacterium]|uniref:Uncharacterized protein n=1 Tax=Corynebacterium hadale TaxID=2026255 RepID=A0A269PDJ8_9CORY|nr:hypothetical protein [Corynebacterium hadale]PAJ69958.1 hypothetical protein CIG21_05840 [Corynebacterium hadale]